MALMLPAAHPLAGRAAIPLAELSGTTVYAGAGNERTREWTELAALLFTEWGIELAPPVPLAVGVAEFQRVMAKGGHPVLAVTEFPPLPGTVLRPLVDPVPLSPLTMVWRKGLRHPGLDALRTAADRLGKGKGGWSGLPAPGCPRGTCP